MRHRPRDLFSAQLIPWGGDDRRFCILRTQRFHTRLCQIRIRMLGTAQQEHIRMFDLIVEKLTEVLAVHRLSLIHI